MHKIYIRLNSDSEYFYSSIKSHLLILYKRMLPLFLSICVYTRFLTVALSFSLALCQCMTLLMDLDMCVQCVCLCVWTGWIIRFSKRQMMTADCSTRDRDTPTAPMHWKEIVRAHIDENNRSLLSIAHTRTATVVLCHSFVWVHSHIDARSIET